MSDIKTQAYPKIIGTSGALFADATALINFDRIGKLDTLLAADRTIIITPEVYTEAVTKALASGNPVALASAQRIDSWLTLHSSLGDVRIGASDPNRPLFTGPGAGETSILADSVFLGGNNVIISDDNHIALTSVAGSLTGVPILTGNYFLNSLLLGGAITPGDYFQQTQAGARADRSSFRRPAAPFTLGRNGTSQQSPVDNQTQGWKLAAHTLPSARL